MALQIGLCRGIQTLTASVDLLLEEAILNFYTILILYHEIIVPADSNFILDHFGMS